MKPILILIFSLLPLALFAQQIEPGVWVKATLEREDGSIVPAPIDNFEQFVKYRFSADGVLSVSGDLLFNQIDTQYNIENGVLTLGFVKYKVDKLTRDSLVVHGIGKAKSKITYCYKRMGGGNMASKPEFNKTIQDSVYASTRYLFPECVSDVHEFLPPRNYDVAFQGGLQVSFIIDKTGLLVDLKIDARPGTDKDFVDNVSKCLQSDKLKWLPAKVGGQNVNTSVKFLLGYFAGDYLKAKSPLGNRSGLAVVYLLN